MALTIAKIADLWLKFMGSDNTSATEDTLVRRPLFEKLYFAHKLGPVATFAALNADNAAGDATAEHVIMEIENAGELKEFNIRPTAAMAADNTDYVTITIKKRSAAGGAGTTVATYDSRAANNGALVAFATMAFTLTATLTDRRLTAGDCLTCTIAKAGAGKVVPASTYHARVDESVT